MSAPYALAFPVLPGDLIPEARYVGAILDRPESELAHARKFATAADAAAYRDARPRLRGAEIVGPIEPEGGR